MQQYQPHKTESIRKRMTGEPLMIQAMSFPGLPEIIEHWWCCVNITVLIKIGRSIVMHRLENVFN